jgi:hypothetical protein
MRAGLAANPSSPSLIPTCAGPCREIYRADGVASLAPVGGYLVDVSGPRGFQWSTSRTRTDTGDGACEIVWVETLHVR